MEQEDVGGLYSGVTLKGPSCLPQDETNREEEKGPVWGRGEPLAAPMPREHKPGGTAGANEGVSEE